MNKLRWWASKAANYRPCRARCASAADLQRLYGGYRQERGATVQAPGALARPIAAPARDGVKLGERMPKKLDLRARSHQDGVILRRACLETDCERCPLSRQK